ncbi:MAG: DUF427 domain-containing protein [Caulobacteraceae bacterium]
MDTIKTPGPDHPIDFAAAPARMRARFQGHVIADSADAILVTEEGYKPVCYFPREDVDMAFFGRTARDSHCPYKGHAAYFTLRMDGAIVEDAAWTYEEPYPAVDILRGRIAFFPHPVEVYEVAEESPTPSPDSVVQHTDAGDGASQAPKWPVTASEPDEP